MTLCAIEGFDHMSSTDLMYSKNWTFQAQEFTFSPSFDTGRVIGHSFRMNATVANETGYGLFAKTLPATQDHLVCGFAFKSGQMPGLGGSASIWRFWTDAGGTVATVNVTQTGRIQILRPDGTVVGQSATDVFTANAWHFIEVKLVVNGASSSVQAYLNNVEVIASTSCNLGSTAVEQFGPYAVLGSGTSGWVWDAYGDADINLWWDDVYMLETVNAPNDDFLGDCHCETVFPKGAGSHTDWTPLSGANWQNVKEHTSAPYPDDDTTYVYTHTLNAIDTYDMDDLTITSGEVLGLQPNVYARKYDALLRQLGTVVVSGATDYVNANPHTLAVGWIDGTDIYDTDPDTGMQWTVVGVNAAEFGMKLVT